MVLNGKGVRDTPLGVTAPTALLYNDEDFMLETICGRAGAAGGVKSSATLKAPGIPADNDTVTIGELVYTFKTELTPTVRFEVFAGYNTSDALANLKAAINYEPGVGQKYSQGTPQHPTVICTSVDAAELTIESKVGGSLSNNVVTRAASQKLSWNTPTLTGGTDFKLTFGVAMPGESVEECASIIAPGGELNFSNSSNITKTANLLSNRVILPAGSWLVLKSVSGAPGELTNTVLFVKRRRLTGHL